MSDNPIDLDALRREIDQIDDRLHDLLIQRAETVQRLASVKRSGPAMRPEREASILRRLVGRHRGPLPAGVVGRIWREIIASLTRFQSPHSVALYAAYGTIEHFDVARAHFGAARIDLHDTPVQALRAVAESAGQVIAVMPLPGSEEQAWWPLLASTDSQRPRIVARLPFLRDGTSPVEAVVVAPFGPGLSGDDASYLIIVTGYGTEISRGRLNDRLVAAGIHGQCLDSRPRGGDTLHLFEVDGLLDDQDPRLQALIAAHGDEIAQAIPVGGYARPLDLAAR
ncbi:chorismate mutase [Zavarzinia compransoris]|uniref:chorismate mutase n=1 Tax=Zavarzinia compransoris TaxID=1264899 RepID=A0A317DYJ7_9PROT|nr:chorismate mutase [Zavarzinia compransoris]PWR18926.1 chorismate mutase [Zavarzinia compransoris]TDP48922.1 chorismate mutase [Zavarzinia compransoris]